MNQYPVNGEGSNASHKSSPVATMKSLSALLREVRLLLAGFPMLAYAFISLWEHFGH